MAFNYQGAVDAGYSDDEITEHLSKNNPNFKLSEAKKAGYSSKEINEHLMKSQPKEEKPDIGNLIKSFSPRLVYESIGILPKTPDEQLSKEEKKARKVYEQLGEFGGGFGAAEAGLKAIAGPISKKTAEWAAKSPYGRGVLESIGSLLGIGATGAAVGTAEEVSHTGELPSIKKMEDHGLTWMAIDFGLKSLGKLGSFTKALYSGVKESGQTADKLLQDTAKKIEKSGLNFANASQPPDLKKLNEVAFSSLQESIAENAAKKAERKFAEAPDQIELAKTRTELAEEVAAAETTAFEEGLVKELQEFHPEYESSEKFGKQVQQSIQKEYEVAKQQENSLYDFVEKRAQNITEDLKITEKEARKALEKFEEVKLKPEGYGAVEKRLAEVVATIAENPTLAQAMTLGRRLNEIIAYEAIDPHVSKILIPVKNAVKNDIKQILQIHDKQAAKIFEEAESLHGVNAEKFGNEPIRKIRREEFPERIARQAESPTQIQGLKKVIKDEKLIDRAVLEAIQQAGEKKAAQLFRENRKYLSEEGQKLADKILKHKTTKPTKIEIKESPEEIRVRKELSSLSEAGTVPQKTLDMWATPKGKKIVKDALKGSPQKESVEKYLSEKYIEQSLESLMDHANGKIDLKRLKTFIKDPENKKLIFEAAGKEGVEVFNNLEGVLKNIEKLEEIAKTSHPITKKINQVVEQLGPAGKALAIAGGLTHIPLAKAASITYALLYIAENPQIRKAFKEASAKNTKPLLTLLSLISLDAETKSSRNQERAPTNKTKRKE